MILEAERKLTIEVNGTSWGSGTVYVTQKGEN